jgi:lysophospholipase L1-like esterase
VILLLGAGLAALLAAEVALRLLLPSLAFVPVLGLTPGLTSQLVIDAPGMSPRATHTRNWWGLRGDNPPWPWSAHESILAVGSSTTGGAFLDDKVTWPARLQARLRRVDPGVWVGNAGQDGATTPEILAAAEVLVPAIRPRWLLVLPGANDLGRPLAAPPPQDGGPAGWRLLGHSQLLTTAYSVQAWLRQRAQAVPTSEYVAESRPSRPTAAELDPASLAPGLTTYRGLLARLVALQDGDRTRVVLLTHPFPSNDEGNGPMMAVYNAAVLDVCAAMAARCIDVAGVLGANPRYFYDHVHLSETGAAAVADAIAAALVGDFAGR